MRKSLLLKIQSVNYQQNAMPIPRRISPREEVLGRQTNNGEASDWVKTIFFGKSSSFKSVTLSVKD